jgi:hypothetical protein
MAATQLGQGRHDDDRPDAASAWGAKWWRRRHLPVLSPFAAFTVGMGPRLAVSPLAQAFGARQPRIGGGRARRPAGRADARHSGHGFAGWGQNI